MLETASTKLNRRKHFTNTLLILINENAAVVFGNRRDIHVHMPWPLSLDVKKTPNFMQKRFFSSASYQSTYHGVILHPLSHIFDSPPDTDYLTLKRALIAEDDSDDDVSIGTNDQFDENNALQPPSTHRPIGRPKKRRIRSLNGETTIRSFKCSRCKGLGHSRRTCKDPI